MAPVHLSTNTCVFLIYPCKSSWYGFSEYNSCPQMLGVMGKALRDFKHGDKWKTTI